MSDEGLDWIEIHDDEEVEHALADLSSADLDRLLIAAEGWIRVMGLDAVGRDHDDLLSEALTRTLDGTRSWRRGVDFCYNLIRTMRSIASSWRKSAVRRSSAGVVRSADVMPPGNPERFHDPVEEAASGEPGVEAVLLAAEAVQGYEALFAGDRAASEVLAGWRAGRKGPEIRERAAMSKREFQAAVRRIRRAAQRGGPDRVH